MDLSIVIPVYNAEKFLGRCLKSVFKSVAMAPGVTAEIILVDNGSTDRSPEIATEFAADAPLKIRMLKCDVPGCGSVRNYGAKRAKGKYIWFIDADDEISPDAVRKLTTEAEKKEADIVMMGAQRIYPDGHTDYLSAVTPEEPNYQSRFVRYGVGPWQLLIRREWWNKHNFTFRERAIHEDMEITASLILYTDRLAAVDEPLYLYYQNDDSILHKKSWDPHYLDIFSSLTGLYQRFEKAGAADKYHDELEWFFIWNLLIDSNKDFSNFPEGQVGFKRTREMLKEYFPNWRKNKFLRQKPLKLRIRVRLNYHKR